MDALGLAQQEPGSCCADDGISESSCCARVLNGDGGGVACCNGKKVACVGRQANDIGVNFVAYSTVSKCVRDHEESHFPDNQACTPCGIYRAKPVLLLDSNNSECRAYNVQVRCLERSRGYCGTNANYSELIQKEINHARS